jgi:hypothetical protein
MVVYCFYTVGRNKHQQLKYREYGYMNLFTFQYGLKEYFKVNH